ncbi:MAG: TetR/AcrR family transcriptional regulator [Chloroflexota bacterium]
MDRRVKRTRTALQDALIALLREKSLEQIEIQEITDLADTARVTFYRHYGTKEELLLDTMETIYHDLLASIELPTISAMMNLNNNPPMIQLFEFVAQDRAFYKKIFMSSVSSLVQQRLREYIVEQITLAFSKSLMYRTANAPVTLVANNIASLMIGNVTWWLVDDLPYSPEYMARMTRRVLVLGMMGLAGQKGKEK